jgi:NitT/TauT family transport system substrate-binding protein
MRSLLLPVLFVCAFAGPLSAKGARGADNQELTFYVIKGPTGVGMIRLFEEPPALPGFTLRLTALAQADQIAAQFISGEAKLGILPVNAAAKIASSGKRLQAAAVIGSGMLSLLSADSEVQRLEDLRGKTVAAAGQGATPDYVLRKILLSKGLVPDEDVQLNYTLGYAEIAQSLIAGQISLALLPEPFATMARSGNPDLRPAGDIQAEWSAAAGLAGNYPMTLLVADADFAAAHPAVMRRFLDAAKASLEWALANPAEAGTLVEKHELGLRAPVVSAAIPRSNYVFIPAAEARPSLEALYQVFLDFSPASIGGKLPDADFYLSLP